MANETVDAENKNDCPVDRTLSNVPPSSSNQTNYQLPTTSGALTLNQSLPVLLSSTPGQTHGLNNSSSLNLSITPSINLILNAIPSTSTGRYHRYNNLPISFSFNECHELLNKYEIVENSKPATATTTSAPVQTTVSDSTSQLANLNYNTVINRLPRHDTKASVQHNPGYVMATSSHSPWPSTSTSVPTLQTPLEHLPSYMPMTNHYSSLPSSSSSIPMEQVVQIKQEPKRKWKPISTAQMSAALQKVIQFQQEAKRKRETKLVSIQMVKANAPTDLVNRTNPISQVSYPQMIPVPPVVHTLPLVIPSISTSPPLPPNWDEHLKDTIMSMSSYKLFPVSSNSSEYATLAAMLDPIQITVAEQVVNPSLWSRFVNTRKEMLLSKCDDVQFLSTLGLDEEIAMETMQSSSFTKDPAITAYPYNDNMALLFHCTRSTRNVESILRQGLDERLSQVTGRAGRGIYFADDPNKSIQYDACGGIIFIFAVLLGDCLSVNHFKNKRFLREPGKLEVQKRNFNDFNFDSIVIQTIVSTEYVVYNRYQCCPLYKIQYKKPTSVNTVAFNNAGANHYLNNEYLLFRNKLPPFSWVPRFNKPPMPNNSANTTWPFYAETVFRQISVESNAPQKQTVDQVVPAIDKWPDISTDTAINEKLTMLSNLGFKDFDLNLKTLIQFEYCLETSVNHLLDQAANSVRKDQFAETNSSENMLASTSSPRPGPSSTSDEMLFANTLNSNASFGSNSTSTPVLPVECPICCNAYVSNDIHWKVLQCSHKLCVNCYEQIETTRTTMSGATYTFAKCPFCLRTYGTEIGTCPNGHMRELAVRTSCEGYEAYNTICIRYSVQDSIYRLYRTAYIPDNDEGRKVVKLLRIAWDRRLTFNVGTSSTTGQENVLVWNIHHKTAQRGGVQLHGYPDPTYFERVKLELKTYDIE